MAGGIAIKVATDVWKRRVRLIKKQSAFATAVALTRTAKLAEQKVTRRLPRTFDRPNPWTKRAIAILPAKKQNPVAYVFVKDSQAKYLTIQETGGTRRRQSGKPINVPVNVRTNRYGNIPRRYIKQSLAKKNFYAITEAQARKTGQTPGIYRRGRGKDGGTQLMTAVVKEAKYHRRFAFKLTVRNEANKVYRREFERAFEKAMDTAR